MICSKAWQRSSFGNWKKFTARREADLESMGPGPGSENSREREAGPRHWEMTTQTHECQACSFIYLFNCAIFPFRGCGGRNIYISHHCYQHGLKMTFLLLLINKTFITDSLPAELRHCVKQYIASVWQISCL